jgi:hypothetical protein
MKLTGENRQLGEKPVPVPLCPSQISHWTDPGSNPGLRGERPATNRLSHGTAADLLTALQPLIEFLCIFFSIFILTQQIRITYLPERQFKMSR